MTILTVNDRLQKSKEYMQEFQKIFGFKAPIHGGLTYIHKYMYLDLFQLSDMLKVPESKSLKEFINEKYGQNACKLVDNWLDL